MASYTVTIRLHASLRNRTSPSMGNYWAFQTPCQILQHPRVWRRVPARNVACPFHSQMLPDPLSSSSILCFAQDPIAWSWSRLQETSGFLSIWMGQVVYGAGSVFYLHQHSLPCWVCPAAPYFTAYISIISLSNCSHIIAFTNKIFPSSSSYLLLLTHRPIYSLSQG